MPSLPISAFIITRDEADRIATVIASLRGLVDEIVVVDSGSKDETVATAETAGARVVFNPWRGYGPQKRFAEELCRHRWLLNLDADEEMTNALALEIREAFRDGAPALAGFRLRIKDLLPGETRLAPFAYSNLQLRLYDRTKARFSDSPVFDSVQVHEGKVRTLAGPVLHRSIRSWSHSLDKYNRYTDALVEAKRARPVRFAWVRLVTEFPIAFIKNYIFRGYVFRGKRGFINAMLYAFSRFLKVAKTIEKQDES